MIHPQTAEKQRGDRCVTVSAERLRSGAGIFYETNQRNQSARRTIL